MCLLEIELVSMYINNAVLNAEKAQAALVAFKMNPNQLLAEIALDYLETVNSHHLNCVQAIVDEWSNKKTPAGAANTDEGKVEKVLEGSDSASIVQ